ncbi:unnamed protein product [Dovyalis caffra]|uniref:Myb-like domain-containing protein n=1 Tax=Dovyalis caffra TaxID=77055 RepID=A0AAV1S922_9ROSI|nr:unnamed protein product [Dovyalis caffra]
MVNTTSCSSVKPKHHHGTIHKNTTTKKVLLLNDNANPNHLLTKSLNHPPPWTIPPLLSCAISLIPLIFHHHHNHKKTHFSLFPLVLPPHSPPSKPLICELAPIFLPSQRKPLIYTSTHVHTTQQRIALTSARSNPLQATALQALPAPPTQPSTNPRRLPPPCWTPDETVALIDAYRDKWYTLRRGNLKANHWQEVADAVARRCPAASPPKTAVQCRHKMEKLRKRYRTEIQRARSMPVSRFSSSWVHFKRMDAMEKGPQAKADYNSESEGDDNDDDNEEDGDIHGSYLDNYRNANNVMNTRSIQKLYRNGIGNPGSSGGNNGLSGGNSSLGSGNAGGFRIRIPTGVSIAQPGPKFYAKAEQKYGGSPNMGVNASPNPNLKPNYGGGVGGSSRAVRGVLGDGFVRMEQMKMEMAREMETMRMEMEMKRTEMILESQQRIVEAFAKALSEKKKRPKRMPSPEDSTLVGIGMTLVHNSSSYCLCLRIGCLHFKHFLADIFVHAFLVDGWNLEGRDMRKALYLEASVVCECFPGLVYLVKECG